MQENKKSAGKKGQGEKTEKEALQEELLSEAFQACMEEQLSFIPPEREIARMHTFSGEFQEFMEELCRTKGKFRKREMTRREFVFGFNKLAACILLVLVAGGIFAGGYLISVRGLTGRDGAGEMAAAEEAADTAVQEETVQESTVSDSAAEEADESSGSVAGAQTEFMGSMIPLAAEQEIPAGTEEIKTLVSSPVLDRDAESVKVTIGNLSEKTISYHTGMEIQVYLDGAWYVVPKKAAQTETPEEQVSGQEQAVELEAGMAQDEEIWLADYELDYEAEKYRVVVYVNEMPFGSEFWFETLEEGLEEALESTLDEPEQ